MAFSQILKLMPLLAVMCNSLNIFETVQLTPEFSVLAEAVSADTNLATTLRGVGPFTVFAPTNDAFTAALTAMSITKAELLARKDLADIVQYHVLSGKIMAADLEVTQNPATLQGSTVEVHKNGPTVTFGQAYVIKADIACSNGVIHQIDKVMLPPAEVPTTTAPKQKPELPVPSGATTRIAGASVLSSVAMMLFA